MNENNYFNPIYIFAISSFLVLYHSTKNHFLPEIWFSGLQIILPQFKTTSSSITKEDKVLEPLRKRKNLKKKEETFVQIVTVKYFL